MGNTDLALRHFREALKLDPEHQATRLSTTWPLRGNGRALEGTRECGCGQTGGVGVRADLGVDVLEVWAY